MKSILTYSGKGGVGKSTITYCLYQSFKNKGFKVLVLDMDLNTPSMQYLIDDEDDLISNYQFKGLFLDTPVIKMFISNAINKINSIKPDILLIDTPPSITDIHLALIDKLSISTCLLVSQPSILSKADVEKTVPFFEQRGITVLGIIENMVENNGLDYNYNKLLSLPKEQGLESKQVYENNITIINSLTDDILSKNINSVSQENRLRTIFNESLSLDEALQINGLWYDKEYEEYHFKGGYNSKRSPKDIKFINISTWKELHKAYEDIMERASCISYSDPTTEATYERVERLVDAFKESENPLFMITKNPMTEVPTCVGLIGKGLLKIDDKFNGIPTIEFQAPSGILRMFPHEVIPVNASILNDVLIDGHEYINEGRNLIPSLEGMLMYSYTFGNTVGMPEIKEDESEEDFEKRIENFRNLIIKK